MKNINIQDDEEVARLEAFVEIPSIELGNADLVTAYQEHAVEAMAAELLKVAHKEERPGHLNSKRIRFYIDVIRKSS